MRITAPSTAERCKGTSTSSTNRQIYPDSDAFDVKHDFQDWQRDQSSKLKLSFVRENGQPDKQDVEPRCIPPDKHLRMSRIKADGSYLSKDNDALLRTMTISYVLTEVKIFVLATILNATVCV